MQFISLRTAYKKGGCLAALVLNIRCLHVPSSEQVFEERDELND
jgi:hypothetical protein